MRICVCVCLCIANSCLLFVWYKRSMPLSPVIAVQMGQVKAAEKNFAAVEALINDMESAECPIQLKVLKLMNKYGQLCGKQVDFAYFLIAEPLF